MVAPRADIRLVEEFEDLDFSFYTCDQGATNSQLMGLVPGNGYPFGLNTQRHIDVRTFAAPGASPTNLLTNGSFENGTTGWAVFQNSVTASLSTGSPVSAAFGQKVAIVTCTSVGTGFWDMGVVTSPQPVVSGNISYTATASIYSPSVSSQAQIQLTWYDTNGSILGQAVGVTQPTTIGAWLTLTPVTSTAPVGAAHAEVYVIIQLPSNGDVHYVDGVGLFSQQAASAGAEAWTSSPAGTLIAGALSSTYNHWPALQAPVGVGSTTLTSVSRPLDLTQLGGTPNITLALPNFQASSFTLSGCSLSLSSDGGAHWTSATFAASTHTPVAGNTYVMWPLSAFTSATLDLTKVNAVRITVANSSGGSVMFTAMALRVLDPNWVAKDLDMDNWNGVLRQCIPLDANPGPPVPNNQTLPVLWRSAQIPGGDDPRPINGTWAIVFNTGSQSRYNTVSLNLRDVNGADETQLDLAGRIQAQINGPQPGLSQSLMVGRVVADLDTRTVGDLGTQTMTNLDEVGASVGQSWLQFQIAWGTANSISVTRSTSSITDYQWQGGGLTFTDGTHAFQNNTYYLAVVSLTDAVAQLQVYTLNQTTFAINTLLFDSGAIPDSYRFVRRPGRVGWKTSLGDGDASIRSLRPESLLFAEYRSAILNSVTPVKGVRVYTPITSRIQLWQNWATQPGTGGVSPTVSADSRRTTSGASTRVDITNATAAGQGLLSNILTPSDDPISGIVNWAYTQIDFNLWFPTAALNASGAGITLYLLSQDGSAVPLTMPRIVSNQWQAVRAFAPPGLQSGRYQLGLTYVGTIPTTFWVDSVNVSERNLVWSARANQNDVWVDLRDEIGSDYEGAIFTARGTQLQVRAQAMRQDAAVVGAPKIIPIYAEPGRLVWPEDAVADPVTLSAPTPISSSGSVHGAPTTFTSGVTPTPAGTIVNWFWAFGDGGASNGPIVKHTYAASGTYPVTLTVEDIYGARTNYTTSVGIS